ncbi:DUF6461 domain-containing protein [Actinoplanes sp. NEAU-A12]|uniref:DUF6461 domain-containing protein n=1 Tax=Actinoplanes sandaracinus TaxID=3045177 RepID=A0ABT6WSG6_9ACTN|nr:DUF6461 domain-containing protein [Actinoplanes sandaracinus]MDI6102677.1 DUF6461 domain-containing protein [Actinoplanes sandaracinus]
MSDLSDLADFVTAAVPVLSRRIPAAPARLLGRLAVPEETAAGRARPPVDGEPDFFTALRALGPLPVERLLGALELTIDRYDWSGAPDLVSGLPQPSPARFAMVTAGGHDSAATSEAALLHRLRPGLADRTGALVRELVTHPGIVPLLRVETAATDEPSIAAAHGTAHLALAVAIAGAVVHQAGPPVIVDRAAATVGLGVGLAARLLLEAPLPAAYSAALLAKVRAEYLLPRHSHSSVPVAGHRFGLAEHELPGLADFSGNGLVAVADGDGRAAAADGDGPAAAPGGGVVVRTGAATGSVRVELVILEEAPAEAESGWEEIVEVSWRATEGRASVMSPAGTSGHGLRRETPPWPGDYRVRVHARGRDDDDPALESYKLVVWAAPPAPETVFRRSDQLGHRLRGEPEPARPPEHAYRWIRRGPLQVAATVTVVTGATVREVLVAFGADPERPEAIGDIQRYLSLRRSHGQWITVLDAGTAVLVVEDNGYRGTDQAVLEAASVHGRAASMFWNVNAVTRLSFAEAGRLLAMHEPWGHEQWAPELAEVLTGLDFAEVGDRNEKGLLAVERFTGRGLTPADLAAIERAGTGYRIME